MKLFKYEVAMRVFVTGAKGYIGHAVAKAFRSKGHTVYGLVRSQEDANDLQIHEILPVIGNLSQPDTFQNILDGIEVVAHCAFDYSDDGVKTDLNTINLIIKKFSDSKLPRFFIYTSGIWVYGSRGSEIVDESSTLKPVDTVKWRPEHEQTVLAASTADLRTVVIRPGVVYGQLGGIMNFFYASIQNGFVPYIGEGNNHWPMVHIEDLAHAYVSAAEKEINHAILNVVDDANPTMKEIAESIARSANMEGKTKSLSVQEAQSLIGDLWQGLAIDLKVNNSRIKRLLHWQIHHAPFVNEGEIYYQAWQANQKVECF